MPRSLPRFLAVALLALTIAVQGAAAVAAGQCMTLGHHEDMSSGHVHDGDDGHDGHAHAAHSHGDEAAAQQDQDGKKAHCGPCTACCASASIAGTASLPILSAASSAEYAFSQSPPPSVQLDGLDRPPLSL